MDLMVGVPLLIGIGQVVKMTEVIAKRFLPLTILVVGVVMFLFLGEGTVTDRFVEGAISALSAMGLWSGVKATIE